MIFDLHNDILTSDLTTFDKSSEIVDYSTNGNLYGAIFALWTNSKFTFDKFNDLMNESTSFLQQNSVSNKSKFLLSIEDLHFLEDCYLERFMEFPLVSCNLTWNESNSLAGGALSQGHLTKFGEQVVSSLCENNKLIDLAHLNRTSFYEVVDKCGDNVWVTHTSIDEKFAHPRNLTDDQIKLVIERDGLVGLTLVSSFMTNGKADILGFANLIEFFVDKYGAKNLAIGTDFFGTTNGVIDLDNYSAFDRLQYLLIEKGMSSESINDIMCLNSVRFLRKHNII